MVCARRFGIVFAVASALNLVIPGLSRTGMYLPVLAALVVVIVGFSQLPSRHGMLWAGITYAAGLLALAAFLLPGAAVDSPSTVSTATTIASATIASLLVAFGHRRELPVIATVAMLPVIAIAAVATAPFGRVAFVVLAIVGGWAGMACAGIWLARSERGAELGRQRLRQGFADERRSTEAEAELRYGARMMHDTVLATLTLIAHQGRGVDAAALRAQAAADSALLAQLRAGGAGEGGEGQAVAAHRGSLDESESESEHGNGGGSERGTGSGIGSGSQASIGAAPSLADPWAGVDAWCTTHAFTVDWHGDRVFDAAPAPREALVRAVAECLENVRRHSGEQRAEVTVSRHDAAVRAVVTDSGVGFERERVPPGRLGIAQSVEARMRAAGGSARIFSSPGRGTTVLLEVPR
jgi:signal transduction histidine kinase